MVMTIGIRLLRGFRALAFFLWSTFCASLVVLVQVICLPVIHFTDPDRAFYQKLMAALARLALWPFVKVTIEGWENIPKGRAAVFTANHQSALDAFMLASITGVNLKSTFKRELLLYPGVGQALALTGHLWVKRGDRASGKRLIANCVAYIQRGVSVLFFPEGTRKIDGAKGPLGEFKAGAFRVASDCEVDIIPITISGARSLLPPKGLPSLGWGHPVMTIHPPISSKGKTVDQLMQDTQTAIASALRECDHLKSD